MKFSILSALIGATAAMSNSELFLKEQIDMIENQ